MRLGIFNRVDLNAANKATDFIDTKDYNRVAMQVTLETGTFATAVVTLEASTDQIAWTNLATVGPGNGKTAAQDVTGYQFVRARVTTAEGAAGTATVSFVGKNA